MAFFLQQNILNKESVDEKYLFKNITMKTKLFLITGLLIAISFVLKAQITPYTYYDESLDLNITSLLFGKASSLQEFEQFLNDPRIQASNLDLNNDGYIDYLKVIGVYQHNKYIIQIQSTLGMNQYERIASIIVGNISYRNPSIQIQGNPAIYGRNYFLTPVYSQRPNILWSFSTLNYHTWESPYYWGYYPRNYNYRRVISMGNYYRHLNLHFGFKYPERYYDNRNWSHNSHNYPSGKNNYNNNNPSPSHQNSDYQKNVNENKTAPTNARYRSPSGNTNNNYNINSEQENKKRSTIKTSVITKSPVIQNTPHPVSRQSGNSSSRNAIKKSESSNPKSTPTRSRSISGTKSTTNTKNAEKTESIKKTKTSKPVRR